MTFQYSLFYIAKRKGFSRRQRENVKDLFKCFVLKRAKRTSKSYVKLLFEMCCDLTQTT